MKRIRLARGFYKSPPRTPTAEGSYVLRYTSPTTGKRREMGLGVGMFRSGSSWLVPTFESAARSEYELAVSLLREGIDPIDQRDEDPDRWIRTVFNFAKEDT